MDTNQKLESLSLPQLHMLLKHLRLGQDHLRLLLTEGQMNELLKWCRLSEEQKEQIQSNRVEKLGNMSLIINTILTSTFGAWMGLSGCIGCSLGSYRILLFVALLAFFVSGLIGYITLSHTQDQALNAVIKQRLFNLQLRILRMINQKLNEKSETASFYLNTAVFLLGNHREEENRKTQELNFNSASEAYEWFENLKKVLEEHLKELETDAASELYRKELPRISYHIKKTIAKHIHFLENLAHAVEEEEKQTKMRPALPFLKLLTNPSFAVPKYHSHSPASWVRDNLKQLLMGLTPTIWGSFASMFVFVGGIPNITRELGFVSLADSLTTPEARLIEIFMAILVTCYLAFSNLYSARKSWQRQKIFEQTEKAITNEETRMLEINQKMSMLFKLKNHTQKMISILRVLKTLHPHLVDSADQAKMDTDFQMFKAISPKLALPSKRRRFTTSL